MKFTSRFRNSFVVKCTKLYLGFSDLTFLLHNVYGISILPAQCSKNRY